jgi:hypothetical protein
MMGWYVVNGFTLLPGKLSSLGLVAGAVTLIAMLVCLFDSAHHLCNGIWTGLGLIRRVCNSIGRWTIKAQAWIKKLMRLVREIFGTGHRKRK